jgi:hypothetical protein
MHFPFVPEGPGLSAVILWEYNMCILYIDEPSGARQGGIYVNVHHFLGLWHVPTGPIDKASAENSAK